MPTEQEEYPELATTAHWRGMMKRAREAAKLTQEALGARVGVSQNVISGLESGKVLASKAVLKICAELKIPSPHALVRDDVDRRWIEAGRVLRGVAPQTFETLLRTAEEFAQQSERASSSH